MREVVVALATLALLGCAESRPTPADKEKQTPPPQAALDLTGTHWVLSSDPAHAADAPTVDFGFQNRASGFTGCNQWFGNYDDSTGLRFQSLGATRRACPEPAMQTERDFLDALTATVAVNRDDDGALRLTGADGATLLTLHPRT